MPRSVYFSQSYRNEQNLLEDLMVESMQIMGHDVFYIPRKIVKQDFILNEDIISSFDNAFSLEMYVESVDGFEGDGDLMTKFGLEIRDQVTLVCSRKRWNALIGRHGYTSNSVRPLEGDLIYLPLSGGLFEIKFVEDKNPFFQLGGSGRSKANNPTFKLICELFEYSGQEIDTGIDDIDNIQVAHSQTYRAEVEFDTSDMHILNETLTITLPSGVVGETEALRYTYDDDDKIILSVGNLTFNDGNFHALVPNTTFLGQTSNVTSTIVAVIGLDDGDAVLFENDGLTQNSTFEIEGFNFIDFSESNPFGQPN